MSIFRIKSLFIILYVLGLSLLFSLSVWQYNRGVEKQTVLALQGSSEPAQLEKQPDDWSLYNYQQVELRGVWRAGHSLLLENRVYKGQVGFEVLSMFELDADHSHVLVNRGWIANAEQDTQLNQSSLPQSERIHGLIYTPDIGITFGDAILPEAMQSEQWPKKSLYLDLPAFERTLATELAPVMLVLDAQSPASFIKTWTAVVITPAKHFGYAVQWLGLGITLMIYGVIWFRRQNKPE